MKPLCYAMLVMLVGASKELLVGSIGSICLLGVLPYIFRRPLLDADSNAGIPWKWGGVVLLWVVLGAGFVFMIMDGLWG